MVDRCHFAWYFSAGLNNLRYGGRVPSEREGMERSNHRRILRSRCDRRTGFMDVDESSRIIISVRLKNR
jgi:hypothetical protein